MNAYEDLLTRTRETHLLSATAGLLSWDQETMLPAGGVAFRAQQLKLLATLVHARSTAPEIGELLRACEETQELVADPTSPSAVNLRELRRGYDQATKLPAELVAELSETESLAQHAWAKARAASDFPAFRPWLEKMVTLLRRKAECLGTPEGGEAWDALGELFEPGMRARDLEPLFADLKGKLRALLGRLQDDGEAPAGSLHRVELPEDRQEAFVRFVAGQIGFDYERGRLDRSTHPFTSGSHPGDVRMTTRFHRDNLLDALGSTMHEAGHSLYEQGLSADHVGEPMGTAVSLGIHESQSRLWENMIGRSRAFWQWCQPELARFFGTALGGYPAEACFGAANLVQPDFIRVEADEVCYNLHVMIRFEIELALLRGELEVEGVPAVWNAKYREALGLEVQDDAVGCLQDVHWSCGLFGYFPTYTLGNIYAAQFFGQAEKELPELEAQCARGEFTPLRTWLNEKVHRHGSRFLPGDLVEHVTGARPDPSHLLGYLEGKLLPLYGLD